MAWNEPGKGNDNRWGNSTNGGRKNNDPWGNSNQGPPDLDDMLNSLKDQLGGIFGGKRSGGGQSNEPVPTGLIGVILVVLIGVWGFLGVYQVDEKERGVILRLGKYHETVGPGLHWNPYLIDTRTTVLVTQEQQYNTRGLMLTQDENIVEVPVSVQYNIPDPKAYVLNVKDPETSLKHATDSAIRHVVGSTTSSNVLSEGREAMAIETRDRLQRYLDLYQTGISITRINILKAEPPAAVKEAFDDVVSAKEDKDRFQNEAEAYANSVVPEARGKAQRIEQEAIAYRDRLIAEAEGEAKRFRQLYAEYKKAPGVTRERLYLNTIEKVMSNTSKVMVDVEGGNNMMYLPLDKIVNQSTSNRESNLSDEQVIRQAVEETLNKIIRESSNTRRADVR